jgi:hypothetical protein
VGLPGIRRKNRCRRFELHRRLSLNADLLNGWRQAVAHECLERLSRFHKSNTWNPSAANQAVWNFAPWGMSPSQFTSLRASAYCPSVISGQCMSMMVAIVCLPPPDVRSRGCFGWLFETALSLFAGKLISGR